MRNVFCRLRGLLGQLLDLVGDNRESLARLACSRCLNRGVQGQQIGLLGDGRDDFDDLADLDAGLAQVLNRQVR